MSTIYLLLAILTLIFTFITQKKYSYNLKKVIPILLFGMAISLIILIFPISPGHNLISKLVYSIIYSAQTIFLGEDVDLITGLTPITAIEHIYIGVIYILLLAMPLLTASFLASLLNGITTKLKLRFISKKEIIIFSKLNEKSITIAEKINAKDNLFIFADYQADNEFTSRLNNLKALKLEEDVNDIEIKYLNSKNITFYILSENEDENLNKTLKLIDKYNQKDIKIYLITNNSIASTILDSADKGQIKLEIVNETERSVCKVLEEKPLYLNAQNNQISVLIIGCGKVGLEFLKSVTWCGQIIGYNLHITIADKNANKIKEQIALNYPELLPNYNYNFIEVDVTSNKLEQMLDKIDNINYVIIALNNEEDSLKAALVLRRYFESRPNFNIKPIINIWIENPLKNKQINNLKNQKNNRYNLNAFGSIKQMYYTSPIINSQMEEMTKQVHLAYDPNNQTLDNFYDKDYNIKSSRAFALHIKYKIYSVLKENFTGNLEIDLSEFKEKLKDQNILTALIENEHNRWMAYMRSNGYKLATCEEVNNYKNIINTHVNSLAKLHPALVEYDKLKEVEKEIGISLQNKDKYIITKIPDIITCNQKVKKQNSKYIPHPIDTSAIILNDEIMKLSEKLAKNVHEVWAKNKLEEGWTYGPKTNANLKTHSSLIPYENLSEQEKDYDRNTLIESLKVLDKLGYTIEKKTERRK